MGLALGYIFLITEERLGVKKWNNSQKQRDLCTISYLKTISNILSSLKRSKKREETTWIFSSLYHCEYALILLYPEIGSLWFLGSPIQHRLRVAFGVVGVRGDSKGVGTPVTGHLVFLVNIIYNTFLYSGNKFLLSTNYKPELF